jgi:hypothetical protein
LNISKVNPRRSTSIGKCTVGSFDWQTPAREEEASEIFLDCPCPLWVIRVVLPRAHDFRFWVAKRPLD